MKRALLYQGSLTSATPLTLCVALQGRAATCLAALVKPRASSRGSRSPLWPWSPLSTKRRQALMVHHHLGF